MSKIIFTQTWGKDPLMISEYPEELEINVSFSSDASLGQVITAFRVFLKACEYSQAGIEERLGA